MELKVDDLVFAKVKGFRPWPARIMELQGAKAQVFFFGSYDIGFIPLKDIHHFNEDSKKKFCKANEKSKPFLKALVEIVESPDLLPFHGPPAEETPEKPKKGRPILKMIRNIEKFGFKSRTQKISSRLTWIKIVL